MSSQRKTGRCPPAFVAARPAGQRKGVEVRARMPKCGAKSRQTGEPCRQPVKEEGKRCRYHGGATPKGRQWHRRQLPRKGQSPRSYAAKLRALERRDHEAEQRRAHMTEEERQAHEKRRKPKRPETPAERIAAAHKRRAAALLRPRGGAPSAEALRLAAAIEELEAKAARDVASDAASPDQQQSIGDFQMTTADEKREALERNMHRLATEGMDAATEAAIQILRDPKAPSQARSAAINAVFRAQGLFDRKEEETVELHEMTPAQLDRAIAGLTRQMSKAPPGEGEDQRQNSLSILD